MKYQGDEKIKNFIWDLITPLESGEVQKISRNHSGLHNLVPRGRNAKGNVSIKIYLKNELFGHILGRKGGKHPKDGQPNRSDGDNKDGGSSSSSAPSTSQQNPFMDPNHWSRDEKYDAEAFLEHNYKKHLARHANK